ncbi:hypothetical protein C922_05469 [Plasmodium inui San Antonio 1]|uniref:Uncharacterized protein n=1 Tax=Plasmodium inui San Antonio 1 TaxID=1237626 RepID=W6ZXX1_9APIC|nr:hypothetical protein C922_05469 [Plasmodium inui San Antonio 1]EUD64153.1 hypothetical protein C922_05469 [Plasmodium inui San Antonio 1]
MKQNNILNLPLGHSIIKMPRNRNIFIRRIPREEIPWQTGLSSERKCSIHKNLHSDTARETISIKMASERIY